MGDRQFLLLLRVILVVFTLAALLFALNSKSTMYEMVQNAYKVTLVSCIVPLAAGIYWRHASNVGAMVSVIFGLFAWGVPRFLGEAGAYAQELKRAWPALAAGDAAGFFAAAKAVAVDVAVLERSQRLAVVAGAFDWDDIGSWDALRRVRRPDPRGNVVIGNVTLGDDVEDCVIWAEGEHFAVTGIKATVVVRANGHTLVMPSGQPERLKLLVQRL